MIALKGWVETFSHVHWVTALLWLYISRPWRLVALKCYLYLLTSVFLPFFQLNSQVIGELFSSRE